MRLLAVLVFSALAIGLQAKEQYTKPKVVAVQVNRCPTPTLYTNEQEEENTISIPKGSIEIVKSDFDETLRFTANETGSITIFVTAQKTPFDVSIYRDPTVFRMNQTKFTVNNGPGAVFSFPFEVIKGVQETTIQVVINDGTTEKSTRIYASTKSLEPPRPPLRGTSIFFGDDDVADATNPSAQNPADSVTPAPIVMNATVGSLYQNATGSTWYVVNETFPTADEVINGRYANNTKQNLHLDSITMNRISHVRSDTYQSKSNIYEIFVHQDEEGLIMFNVSGTGRKKVTLKSIAGHIDVTKQADIGFDKYAAFKYWVNINRIKQDRCLLKIENNQGDALYFYLTLSRMQ